MGKFVICKVPTGFTFHLKAANGETVMTSEVYTTHANAARECKSLMEWVLSAEVEDQTVEGFDTLKHPKFEVYEDKGGKFRFRLKARNGEIVSSSQAYTTKQSCKHGIEAIKKNAPGAPVVDEETDK